MKKSIILSLSLTLFLANITISGNTTATLSPLKQIALDAIQDLDPIIRDQAQEKIDVGFAQAAKNINEDIGEIKVAAAFVSILETLDKVLKGMNMNQFRWLLKEIKYSARANSIHKLIMGIIPGQFASKDNYICPYSESLGFVANDWLLNNVAKIAAVKNVLDSAATMAGANDTVKKWTKQVLVGIAAHFAWGIEKYLFVKARGLS